LRGKVEQARFRGLLLGNGWSGDVAEADARARLEARVRRDLAYFTHWPAVLRLAGQENDAEIMPRSLAALRALAGCADRWPRRQSPAAWANDFSAVLVAAGWPGERPLSSHEFQARRAFGELLVDFSRLDPLLGSIDRGTALRRLSQLCRQRLFQPETRGRPAIQVLGVLESAGLCFDGLWVMGMNDDQWPPPPRQSAAPRRVQRAARRPCQRRRVEPDFSPGLKPTATVSARQPLLDMRWPRLPSLRPCPSPLPRRGRQVTQ
jgi:exodeoxyribonuclease-5